MTRAAAARPRILVLGTADWDQAVPTNQHHATRELAQVGDVWFVESTGLRRPELSRRDLARIGRRLAAVVRRPASSGVTRPVPENVVVVKPLVVPFHHAPFTVVNRLLMRLLLRRWRRHRGPRIVWAYTPVTHGLELEAPTVYHCVDLLGAQAGVSRRVVDRGEARLVAAGAVAGASSDVVARHLADAGFARIESWPNVADLAVFGEGADTSSRRPRVVFAGNLTTTKVDFTLLEAVLDAGLDLHLAGPISEGGGDATHEVRRLRDRGATYRGLLSPAELGTLFRESTVGLIPYVLNDYTHGVNPLKTYEYLAAGLAVVSTPVPAVTPDGTDVVVADSTEEFVAQVRRLVAVPGPDELARRAEAASGHGWAARGEQLRALVRELVARQAAPEP